jgi:hypothetical protein
MMRAAARFAVAGLLAAACCAAVVPASWASTVTLPRITYVTPKASPGGTVTVKATAAPGARCNVVIGVPLSVTRHLPPKRFAGGRAVWRYRLPSKAKTGLWTATLQCSSGGSDLRTFKVAIPTVSPAQIKVITTGFVSETYPPSTTVFLVCGVELQNVSKTDAHNVSVQVTFTDTQGSAVATSTSNVGLIPAGRVFHLSCIQQTNVTLTVASIAVRVKVGESTKPLGTLPLVSDLALTPDSTGTQTLSGTITNPSSMALSQGATIYALYYDANGNFVGGSFESAGAAVQPGGSVAFSFPFVPATATSSGVSIDPCGGLTESTGECAVPTDY